jgi:hypothetical protein
MTEQPLGELGEAAGERLLETENYAGQNASRPDRRNREGLIRWLSFFVASGKQGEVEFRQPV